MILLNTVNKSLEVLLGEAIVTQELEWTCTATVMNAAFKSTAVIANDGLTNGVTPVTLCAAPAATFVNQIKLLTVYNADTIAHWVYVRLNNTGAYRRIGPEQLQPRETLQYVA